ncbi:hypothetical protein FDUTEX481_06069 [Tolypothrix sp. PCC 7601]|nr:hypothetical protein FDUTEX481_06069 [Tolypothrix sp. PCC 7601]
MISRQFSYRYPQVLVNNVFLSSLQFRGLTLRKVWFLSICSVLVYNSNRL